MKRSPNTTAWNSSMFEGRTSRPTTKKTDPINGPAIAARLNMPDGVAEELRKRGHDVEVWPRYSSWTAAVCAIKVDPVTGLRHAGADPRREGYAAAW